MSLLPLLSLLSLWFFPWYLYMLSLSWHVSVLVYLWTPQPVMSHSVCVCVCMRVSLSLSLCLPSHVFYVFIILFLHQVCVTRVWVFVPDVFPVLF